MRSRVTVLDVGCAVPSHGISDKAIGVLETGDTLCPRRSSRGLIGLFSWPQLYHRTATCAHESPSGVPGHSIRAYPPGNSTGTNLLAHIMCWKTAHCLRAHCFCFPEAEAQYPGMRTSRICGSCTPRYCTLRLSKDILPRYTLCSSSKAYHIVLAPVPLNPNPEP